MKGLFLASVFLMFAHKVECWLLHEWLDSPFFQWLYESGGILAQTPEEAFGETVFLVFVTWLFFGLVLGLLMMQGGWGPIVALAGWGLTFGLEWHHLARALGQGEYYVGSVTSVLYLGLMLFYWRELLRLVRWGVESERSPSRG